MTLICLIALAAASIAMFYGLFCLNRRIHDLEMAIDSADIDEDALPSVPLSDQFPVTYDPQWEAGQKRQARDDLGVDV